MPCSTATVRASPGGTCLPVSATFASCTPVTRAGATAAYGNRTVSTKQLARQIGAKAVEPCDPQVAQRHSGYLVGGTSPFGTRRQMPVYVEQSILDLPRIVLNGGRRGYLVGMEPQVCVRLLGATPVHCALAE